MRFLMLSGIVIAGVAAMSACSKSDGDAATFCPAYFANAQEIGAAVSPLGGGGSSEAIVKLARSTDKLAEIAPSQLRSSVKVEAAAFHKWANTGDESVLTNYPHLADARGKGNYWVLKHCQK